MGTISLAIDGKAVGPTAALVAPTQFFPVMVSVSFDYATNGRAIVENQNTRGGEWTACDAGGGFLTSNHTFFLTSPLPGLRLKVTRLVAGQIELSVTGADDGSIAVPSILRDGDGASLLDETTGLPLLAE